LPTDAWADTWNPALDPGDKYGFGKFISLSHGRVISGPNGTVLLGQRPKGTPAPMIMVHGPSGAWRWKLVVPEDPFAAREDAPVDGVMTGREVCVSYARTDDQRMRVACFASEDGHRRWEVPVASNTARLMVIGRGLLMVADGQLVRLDLDSGAETWRYPRRSEGPALAMESPTPAVRPPAPDSPRPRAQSGSKPTTPTQPTTPSSTAKQSPPAPAKPCDARALADKADALIAAGQRAEALLQYEAAYPCKPEHEFLLRTFVVACVLRNPTKAKYYFDKLPSADRDARVTSGCADLLGQTPPSAQACDAKALADKAEDLMFAGRHAEALQSYEAAYQCKPELRFAQRALLVACALSNKTKAQYYFDKLPSAGRDARVVARCADLLEQQPQPATAEPCDAKALADKADVLMAAGRRAEALLQYESAYRCKPERGLAQRALLAACASSNEEKARYYADKLPSSDPYVQRVASFCFNIGVDP
jgi:tetratricopeptide (TPR) repeat protein